MNLSTWKKIRKRYPPPEKIITPKVVYDRKREKREFRKMLGSILLDGDLSLKEKEDI